MRWSHAWCLKARVIARTLRSTSPRRHCGAGQALLEFSLILPVLLALVFGVFEVGRLLEASVTIQHAAEEAGRYAATGDAYNQGSGVRESKIVDLARRAMPGLQINSAATSTEPGYFRVVIRSSRSGTSPTEANNAGGANDFVRINIAYNHPFIFPLLGNKLSYLTLRADALVLNEHFARPNGRVGQLPPTPPATRTPVPTPTPRP